MITKAQIKQQLLRSAVKQWSVKSIDSLDPIVKLMLEAFATIAYDNENSIVDIKERLLEQVSSSLVPDNMLSATPAHAVMQVEPLEPEIDINHQTAFFTNRLPRLALKYNLKTIHFVPVVNHLRLVKGQVNYLLTERNLYTRPGGREKELVTRATSFYQGLNRTLWVGFNVDKRITSLKNIHFYIDFPHTENRQELYDLLRYTHWSIDGKPLTMETGLPQEQQTGDLSDGLFGYYNKMQANNDEVMNLYRKQFLYVRNHVHTAHLQKTPFPPELTPFFSERVHSLQPQYWIQITFPPFFKSEDLDDVDIHLNAVPVSNKSLVTTNLYRSRSLTGILPLPVGSGEYYLSVENVEDSHGNVFQFLPYNLSQNAIAGTYTCKRGGLERFNARTLADNLELFNDLIRNEYATFSSFGLKNMDQVILAIGQLIQGIQEKVDINNADTAETPTYLLLEPEEDKKENDASASYWITNCDLANALPPDTVFSPLATLPVAADSCKLLNASSGARAVPKKNELLTAFKYALSTRDQLFSAHDIELFCYMKLTGKVQHVKVQRGITCSDRPNEGLIRTVDVLLTPNPESRALFDAGALGMLKSELEKRSPQINRYRILMENYT